MSERLTALVAERDRLEEQGDYESPGYLYLVERIAELEAAEPATPSAPAPTTEPEATTPAERIAVLERDMREVGLHPERLSDQQGHDLVDRVNAEVRAALDEDSEPEPEPEDVGELAAAMRLAAQTMDRGDLDPVQATELAARFSRAVHHQATHVTPSEELRALLAGNDLEARYAAGAELARRGELPEDVGAQMVSSLNAQVRAAIEAGPLDPERVPAAERDIAARLRDQAAADEAELRGHLDPRDQLTSEVNAMVRRVGEQARERDLATVPAGAPSTEPEET